MFAHNHLSMCLYLVTVIWRDLFHYPILVILSS